MHISAHPTDGLHRRLLIAIAAAIAAFSVIAVSDGVYSADAATRSTSPIY